MVAWRVAALASVCVLASFALLDGCGGGGATGTDQTGASGSSSGNGGGSSGGSSGGSGSSGSSGGSLDGGCKSLCDCIEPCPTKPLPPAAGPPLTLAITKLGFPDVDGNGIADPTSLWRGAFNLDGLAFPTPTTIGHCKPYAGAKPSDVVVDGPDGVDNSFGRNLWPITVGLASDAAAMLAAAIAAGQGTLVIRLAALGAAADQGEIASALFVARGTVDAAGLPVPPNDWATYAWHPIAPWDNALAPGVPTTTSAAWTDGWMVARTWVSGARTDLPFWFQAGSGQDSRLVLHRAVVSATIASDGKSATGRIGGVLAVTELLWAMSVLGPCSSGLCPSHEPFRQAADMIRDATQDPEKTCDGISMAVTFEATVSTLSAEPAAAPLKNMPCCPPSP